MFRRTGRFEAWELGIVDTQQDEIEDGLIWIELKKKKKNLTRILIVWIEGIWRNEMILWSLYRAL